MNVTLCTENGCLYFETLINTPALQTLCAVYNFLCLFSRTHKDNKHLTQTQTNVKTKINSIIKQRFPTSCMYVCMYVCMCVYIHIHTHTYIRKNTHTHTYTHHTQNVKCQDNCGRWIGKDVEGSSHGLF